MTLLAGLRSCVLLALVLAGVYAHAPESSAGVQVQEVKVAVDANVRMKASPTLLKQSGEWVQVAWSGVNASRGDWVGVYSPANADITTTAPIKYKYADKSNQGAGKLLFRLINMRADYVFHYFKGGLKNATLVASSNPVSFENYNEPMQGRLMLTGRVGEMRVMWTTRDAAHPQVMVGTTSGKYQQTVTANTTTYTRDDMCGAPANAEGWRDPGLLHDAVITGLRPDTKYYYVYGDPFFGWSDESTFVSPPLPGMKSEINVFAYGDMGKTTGDDSKEHWDKEAASINTTNLIMTDIETLPMDLVLHIGDISYAVGYSSQWDEFHDQVASIATRLPYMTCTGNHETDFPGSGSRYNGTDSGGECGVPYQARYPMPSTSLDRPWYSFDYGPAHFVLMSTEHNFSIGTEQWLWIDNDLRQVDRSVTPWIIFAGHRPMYIDSIFDSGDAGDQPVARELRRNLEALLSKYKVDLALWGHHHSYQRTCPVYNETCYGPGEATTHVVIGMAGYSLSTKIWPVTPTWARVVNVEEYGYTRLNITPTRLAMTFISNLDAKIKDSFVLTKKV